LPKVTSTSEDLLKTRKKKKKKRDCNLTIL